MNNEKKKTLIVSALFVVLIAVGAFQFMGPKPSAAPSTTTNTATAKLTTPANGTTPVGSVPPSPTGASRQDDGNSHLALASGSGTSGGSSTDKAITGADSTGLKDAVNNVVAANGQSSKVRDPFAKPSNVSGNDSGQSVTPPGVAANANAAKVAPGAPATPNDSRPHKVEGSEWVPPMNPMSGGTLPSANGQSSVGSPTEAAQGSIAVKPIGPRYKLKGVMEGRVLLAILEDSEGNQRIVREGESCDAETKVVKIASGQVTLKEKGKDRVLNLEDKAR